MNLICIPYHDWRKINKEGARTRDAHFLNHLSEHQSVEKLVIINRPITYLELILKKSNAKIKGEKLFQKNGFCLYKVSEKVFIVDFVCTDFFKFLFKKKKWFFDIFGEKRIDDFFHECLFFLGINEKKIFNQNVFSANFIKNNNDIENIFDGWDNFLLFPDNKSIKKELEDAYRNLEKYSNKWITNSSKNIEYFSQNFGVKDITLFKNGVDFEKFQRKYTKPLDLKEIKSPIIGFGGKITHLFDYELYNYCLALHPDKSFVIVGQILNKDVFERINKTSNFYYLGDKNYSEYPSYVCNFNIGIIPYVNNHLDSGADTIKAYEYIAANIMSVGSKGAGMKDHKKYMFIADTKEEFSEFIALALKEKQIDFFLPESNSWKYKVNLLVEIFQEMGN